jgi:hypothetical protein
MFMRGELPSGDGNDRGFDLKVQREAGRQYIWRLIIRARTWPVNRMVDVVAKFGPRPTGPPTPPVLLVTELIRGSLVNCTLVRLTLRHHTS